VRREREEMIVKGMKVRNTEKKREMIMTERKR